MKVKAAIVDAPGQPPRLQDVDLSGPGPGEVLVRVGATGICHTDLGWAEGSLVDAFPVILGHETAGTIQETGEGVTRFSPGDRVILSLAHHCGRCRTCEMGHPMLCENRDDPGGRFRLDGREVIQGFGTGGLAEATVIGERSVVRLPEDVPLEVGALAGCALATGLGAVFTIARVEPGTTVAVIGCGGIGMSVILGAAAAGAGRIVAADPKPERRNHALALGASEALEPTAEVLRELEPDGYDFVFEAAGATAAIELAIPLARRGGTVTLIGVPAVDATVTLPALELVTPQRRILGCLTGDLRPNVDFERYFRLYRNGRLDLEALITARLGPGQIDEAFRRSEAGEGLRTLVTFEQA